MVTVYIGLGGNLNNPVEQVKKALAGLDALSAVNVLKISPLYRSEPMKWSEYSEDQPEYINAVAEIETTLEAHALLDALQALENQQGRVRPNQEGGERWGARIIDLDILLYAESCIKSERLTVPHPGLCERNFVLYPLFDVSPALNVPGIGSLREIKEKCTDRGKISVVEKEGVLA